MAHRKSGSGSSKDKAEVVFVDGTWYHKGDLSGRRQFERDGRIEGSVFVDIDDVCAQESLVRNSNVKCLPHMLPPPNVFAAAMDHLRVKNTSHVVVYGREFLFHVMGRDLSRIHLMQGSLEDWINMGGRIDTRPTEVFSMKDIFHEDKPFRYKAVPPRNILSLQQMIKLLRQPKQHQNHILVDSRGSSFHSNGHIPTATHLPYSDLLQPGHTLRFLPKRKIIQEYERRGIFLQECLDNGTKMVVSCGSGVSVCHIVVSLLECEYDPNLIYVYDGSWAEWKDDPHTPKVLRESNNCKDK